MKNGAEELMARFLANVKQNASVEADNKERERVDQYLQFLREANLPKRHLANRTLVRDSDWELWRKRITNKIGTGLLIALVGNRWTGKTQLAVEVARVCMGGIGDVQRSVLYATTTRFFLDIKASYKADSSDSELDVVNRYRRPGLLILDEFSQRGETDWEHRLLYELIDSRYGDVKDTLLLDNQTSESFVAAIGPSMARRMDETGGVIEANWKAFQAE